MFAYCNNSPLSFCDPRGNSPVQSYVLGDDNCNNIPDYLEIRWYQQTIRASGQLNQVSVSVRTSQDGKRCAVDCSVPFSSFETKDASMNTVYMLDNPLYFYAVCKEIEKLVRGKERREKNSGATLSGSMTFAHIYQELKYHYDGYRTIPKGFSFYESCVIADLNYDEYRIFCLPLYLITVPQVYDKIYVIELSEYSGF